jgi:hypothetical protein
VVLQYIRLQCIYPVLTCFASWCAWWCLDSEKENAPFPDAESMRGGRCVGARDCGSFPKGCPKLQKRQLGEEYYSVFFALSAKQVKPKTSSHPISRLTLTVPLLDAPAESDIY